MADKTSQLSYLLPDFNNFFQYISFALYIYTLLQNTEHSIPFNFPIVIGPLGWWLFVLFADLLVTFEINDLPKLGIFCLTGESREILPAVSKGSIF